ncbi:MerR family transcriptional regulator [Vagococcus fluvialis]|uniref:MerR family transcriptional regulator n=1 Tax=Vagococcus fluvialis TaxID=2738 RepID=UPI001A904CF4|nr:MerR family transcriptional regulator [Vagococcus fluvialis]MBO0436203.1 MerR family transcriptional regulator [Vagococcus fluvialis]
MNQLIKIGEFAQLNNLSVQTLRYYEKIGLIYPVKVDNLTNYRYYDLMQSSVLDMIQFLKSLDFSLEYIKEILNRHDNLEFLQHTLIEQQKELEQKQLQVEMKISQIEAFREATHIYENSRTSNDIELIKLPKRNIIKFSIPDNIYGITAEKYEYHLRQFKKYLATNFPFIPSCSRIGSVMDQYQIKTGKLVSKELFVFFSIKQKTLFKESKTSASLDSLISGIYAVDYCDDFSKESEAIKKFKEKIDTKNLEIIGDYVCEIIYEVPQLHQTKRSMYIRMQVPVKQKRGL